MQALDRSADNKADGPSPLQSTGQCIHGFHKEFHILIHLTTEQFSILPQTILNELWPREHSSISGSYSHMASSLHDPASTNICRLHSERCSQTVISESVPEPMQ
ncbi:hypothetical protein EXN66_Car005991 [Channa argus]|uniref:Uncharacterized protein n=1 Tax=Channa argus TaxID=215402 RepID=A0A6G1PJB7_CHAAH|nr:hypothetical protein EXN66_Car005991 [Channa argus]